MHHGGLMKTKLYMQFDVFITYNNKDQRLAEALCASFEKSGIKCFLGCRDITMGQVYSTASLKALEECRMLLVVYSQNYSTTPQINREIEKATKNDIPVLTVGQSSEEEVLSEAKRYIAWIENLIVLEQSEGSAVVAPSAPSFVAADETVGHEMDIDDSSYEYTEPVKEEESFNTPSFDYMPHVTESAYQPVYDEDIEQNEEDAQSLVEDDDECSTAEDCYRMAEAYYHGEGVRQSYYEAVKWYLKAAEMGHAEAQCDLGNCYYYGEGLPENYERSVYWYEKAAEQGNVRALYNLGNSYCYGEGVTCDEKTAIAYYERAADLGSVQAKERLEELGVRR